MQISIDTIPTNIAVYRYVDGDFIFIDFNKMAEQTDKIKREEVIGKPLREIFPGVEEFGFLEVLQRVYQNGGYEDIDIAFYEDSRISGWRQNRVEKLENGDLIAFYSDMSVQKETEKKLASLGSIIDNTSSEVYIFDEKTLKFTYVNKEALKNMGYSMEEMQNMTPMDIKPEYNSHKFSIILKPLLSKEKNVVTFETLHQRKDGSTYNVEIRLQSMDVNNMKQYVVIASDITKRKLVEMKLQESEEQFRRIAEDSLIGIFIYQEKYVYMNQAFVEMCGYSMPELLDMRPWDVVEGAYKEQVKQISKRRMHGESFPTVYSDMKLMTKSGKVKVVRIATQTIRYNNQYAGMGTVTDITDLQDTKQQLQLLAQAIEQMDELVRITDKDGVITYVNDALVAHTGYKRSELIGKKIGMFKSGVHKECFYENLWETILAGKTFKGVFVNKKKDEQTYFEEEVITPIMDENQHVKYFVATSQDISYRVKMEEQLRKLATIDELTNIYNRHKISEEIDVEIARAQRYQGTFALIMIDIDHFKSINDLYGHDTGDYVLQELSSVILKFIRKSDRFGRWGGEEFMIVSPNLDEKEAIHFANKLKEVVATYPLMNIQKLTISLGVTLFDLRDTKESLLKRVDNALYKSKENGRNGVSFK